MIFKSVHFPNEIVATRRGSPLLIGVKTPKKLKVDFVDVEFGGIAEESKYCRRIFKYLLVPCKIRVRVEI